MYSLAKLKTPKTSQGVGIYADLMRGETKVATIKDEGEGGAMFIDYISGAEQVAFEAFAVEFFAASPPLDPEQRIAFAGSDQSKAEYWINLYVDRYLTAKAFDRQSAKKTIYRLKGESEWVSVSVPYSASVLELLAQRHGEGCVVAVWKQFGEQVPF